MGITTKKDHTFDARVKLPVDQASPANREVWFDSASGKLAFHIGGVDVLIPLPSEVAAGGLTQEQIEDFVALLIVDNTDLDWTYTDGTPSLAAVIKAGSVTNAQHADMAAATIKGRASGAGTGGPVDLTASQVRTIIGTVNDSSLLEGNSLAQVEAAIIATISAGAHAAYDTLLELENLLITDASGIASLVTAVALRPRFYAATVTSGSPTATVTHGFALTNIHDFMAKIVVSATGIEEEYAIVGATTNTVTVTDETGSNIASGRRIFLTAGA